MIRRKMLVLAAAVSALAALPSAAAAYTPYNYFNGGMYPGGTANYGDTVSDRYFSNMFFPSGDKYRVHWDDAFGGNGALSGTTTPLLLNQTTTWPAFADCLRYSTAAGGGTGYRINIICRTMVP